MRAVTIIAGITAAISGVALADSTRLLPPALTIIFVASAIVAISTGIRWERRGEDERQERDTQAG